MEFMEMTYLRKILSFSAIVLVACCDLEAVVAGDRAASPSPAKVDFVQGDSRLAVVIDGSPVAVYVYKPEHITRPFFCHVRTSNGIQVTRNHPPIPGHDLVDHDTMHLGIWMSKPTSLASRPYSQAGP